MNAKIFRRFLGLALLALGATACGTSPVAPDCDDASRCEYIPDSGSFDYIPDSGS